MSEAIKSMNEDGDGFVYGYMCLTDWECEIGAASGGNVIYPSEADLRNRRECVSSCGIVKVRVCFEEIIQEPEEDEEIA